MGSSILASLFAGSLLGVFILLNSLFSGFCIVIYKCFKSVHLLFSIWNGALNVLNRLLAWNYVLVSRGLAYLQTTVNAVTNLCYAASGTLLKLCISFGQFVLDLPFLLWRTTGQLVSIAYNGLYIKILDIFESSGSFLRALAASTCDCIGQIITSISAYVINPFFNICSCIANSGFFSTVYLGIRSSPSFIFNICYSCSKSAFSALQGGCSIIMEALLSILDAVTYLFLSGCKVVTGAFEGLTKCVVDVTNFIVMPFSLENIGHVLKSTFSLLVGIISFPIEIICYVCQAIYWLISLICMEISDMGYYSVEIIKSFNTTPVWTCLLAITFVALPVIFRESIPLHRFRMLMNNLLTSIQTRYHPPQPIIIEEPKPVVIASVIIAKAPEENEDDTPPEKPIVKYESEETICVICQDLKKNTLLLPCRHLCLCACCAERVYRSAKRKRLCPLCRHLITDTMDVFT